jgi:peptide/nickel transport system permease protein
VKSIASSFEAAHLAGESNLRIVITQILPNAPSPIVVMGSLMVATAILLESSPELPGPGRSQPDELGLHDRRGAHRLMRQAWWMSLFPGVAILLTVLALNLVGEGLNDALNTASAHAQGGRMQPTPRPAPHPRT